MVYVYGMRHRGASPGAQPKDGFVEREDDPLGEYEDVLVYSRKLKKSECDQYELDSLGARNRE